MKTNDRRVALGPFLSFCHFEISAVIMRIIVVISNSLLWLSVIAFPSVCSPPRFDRFCEPMIGSWHYDTNQDPYSVAEVMRSCGGAVQGIHDLSLCRMDAIYLNRAYDGFLYWDCGSFLHGPIGGPSPGTVFEVNLGMEDMSRIRITATIDNSLLAVNQMKRFQKGTWARKDKTFDDDDFSVDRRTVEEVGPIDWDSCMQCQMASLSQPWALQRAQWMFQDLSNGNQYKTKQEVSLKIQAWVSMEATVEGTHLRFGAACPKSGLAKEIISKYGINGKLQRVILRKSEGS